MSYISVKMLPPYPQTPQQKLPPVALISPRINPVSPPQRVWLAAICLPSPPPPTMPLFSEHITSTLPFAHSVPAMLASLHVLPQGLCTCYSHCLEESSPQISHGSFLRPFHPQLRVTSPREASLTITENSRAICQPSLPPRCFTCLHSTSDFVTYQLLTCLISHCPITLRRPVLLTVVPPPRRANSDWHTAGTQETFVRYTERSPHPPLSEPRVCVFKGLLTAFPR